MSTGKSFDIIVFGATGYTGRLIAKHLVDGYVASGLMIAMAGRSLSKLATVRAEIGADDKVGLIAADATDRLSLASMIEKGSIVITAAGPYHEHGENLLSVCAEQGVDYLDLSGEPLWMKRMIDAHHQTAQKSGARIFHSAGFDSVPFELGVMFTQQIAIKRLGKPVSRVKGRVRSLVGTPSGGTIASGELSRKLVMEDPNLFKVFVDPFALTPGFRGPPQPTGSKPMDDEHFGAVAPFVMAAINTKNIHRSNMLQGHMYGTDFVYDEMAVVSTDGPADIKFPPPGTGPKQGEGPSEIEREEGSYDVEFLGLDGSSEVRTSVHGAKDPGYGSTSMIIAETALCLREHGKAIPGGIWVPGAALGQRLIDRLSERAGLKFTEL